MMRSEPSSAQRRQRGSSLLVPGTGKTRLLTSWVAGRIDTGLCDPRQVLALTFTARAAAEMRQRLTAALGARAAAVTAATFHSFCFGRLRARDPRLVTVYNGSQRVSLLEMLPGLETPSRARIAAERIQRYYEGMEEPERCASRDHHGLRKLVHGHRRRCSVCLHPWWSGRWASFENPRSSFPNSAGSSARLPSMSCRTSTSRNSSSLSALGETAEALLCIGDPDQAIYGFRGRTASLSSSFATSPTRVFFRLTSIIVPRQPSCAPLERLSRPVGSPEPPALRAQRHGRRSHSRVSGSQSSGRGRQNHLQHP